MLLKYRLEDDRGVSEISAVNEAVYEAVRALAIRVGVIQEGEAGGSRACTLAIEWMLKTYKYEHGVSGFTDAVEAELKVLHELHPDRVRMRWTCQAHQGISCDYALDMGEGKADLCVYKGAVDCPFSKELAV